ncbi:MAG: methyltransferase FkbM family [Gemmatimonadetes bacterium]|nr:methyltransferase FkbM family [Gemmatimonadota bacterium]
MLRKIAAASNVLRHAVLSRGARRFGPAFTRDYARFLLRASRHWGHAAPGHMTLLGREMEYQDQHAVLLFLHEIYSDEAYSFESRVASPRIVDCGANIGFSLLYFSLRFPGARIIAVEADRDNFALLSRNTRSLSPNVDVRNVAVAGAPGFVRFSSRASAGGGITSSIATSEDAASYEVPAITLSSLLQEPTDLLKVDIEGAEYDVLEEAAASGALANVRECILEFHTRHAPGGQARLTALLEGAGMRVAQQGPLRDDTGLLRAVRPS